MTVDDNPLLYPREPLLPFQPIMRAYLCLVLLLSLVSVVHWAYTKRGQSQLQRTGRKQETVDHRRLTVVVYTLPVPRDLQNDHIRRKTHSRQVLSVSVPIPPNGQVKNSPRWHKTVLG